MGFDTIEINLVLLFYFTQIFLDPTKFDSPFFILKLGRPREFNTGKIFDPQKRNIFLGKLD